MKNQNLDLEKTLLEKSKQDKTAFNDLYKYFLNDVYRFSYSLVNNKENAEDITSRVFVEFYKKVDSFVWQNVSLKHWLFRAARNFAYETYREPQTQDFDEDFHIENEYEVSFVDEIMNKDLLEKVKEEVQKLSTVEQEVINLRIWEGLQFNEIAQIQGINEDTTKKRFYRSIEKVKKGLEKRNIKSVIALPFLFTAILQTGALPTYAASAALTTAGISSLVATQTIMPTTITTIKAFLASKAGAAAIAATVLIGSTGTAGVYYANNKRKKTTENTPVAQTTQIPTTSVPTVQPSPTPTGDPYAGWKTYTDTRLGATLKYPSNFEVGVKKQYPTDQVFYDSKGKEVVKPTLLAESIVDTEKEFAAVVSLVDIKNIDFNIERNASFIDGSGSDNAELTNQKLQINGTTYTSKGYNFGDGVSHTAANGKTCMSDSMSYRMYFNIDNNYTVILSYGHDYACDDKTGELIKKDTRKEDIETALKIIKSIEFSNTPTVKPTISMGTYSNGNYSFVYDTAKFSIDTDGNVLHKATNKKMIFSNSFGGVLGSETSCSSYLFTLGINKINRNNTNYFSLVDNQGKCYQSESIIYVCAPGGTPAQGSYADQGYQLKIKVEGGNTGEFDPIVKSIKVLNC